MELDRIGYELVFSLPNFDSETVSCNGSESRTAADKTKSAGRPFCQSTAKALAQCLPSNSALAKCRVEAELATIKGFSQLSLLGEETATIGQNESRQRDMVLQSICWCAYVHLPVMIWTRRTLLGKNRFADQNAHKNRQQHPKVLDDYRLSVNNQQVKAMLLASRCSLAHKQYHTNDFLSQ